MDICERDCYWCFFVNPVDLPEFLYFEFVVEFLFFIVDGCYADFDNEFRTVIFYEFVFFRF